MGFVEAIKSGFSNYVNFSGRSSRSEYWFWVLFTIIGAVVTTMLDNAVVGIEDPLGVGPFYAVFALATFLPGLAVLARRLHDTNRSALWILIGLVPIIGAIVLIIFAILKGDEGDNRFGPNPLLSTT